MTDGLCLCGCGEQTPAASRNQASRGLVKGQPVNWLSGHSRRGIDGYRPKPGRWPALKERLLQGVRVMDGGCWQRRAGREPSGYSRLCVDGVRKFAHRISYEIFVGPIPDGLQVDHQCHNRSGCKGGNKCPHRSCINPEHLAPTTSRENTLNSPNTFQGRNIRKTKCAQGHPFDEENTRVDRQGCRRCRLCQRESTRRYDAAHPKRARQRA